MVILAPVESCAFDEGSLPSQLWYNLLGRPPLAAHRRDPCGELARLVAPAAAQARAGRHRQRTLVAGIDRQRAEAVVQPLLGRAAREGQRRQAAPGRRHPAVQAGGTLKLSLRDREIA